jgi:hypothetical protein
MKTLSLALKKTINTFQGCGSKNVEDILEVLRELERNINTIEIYEEKIDEDIHKACLEDSRDQ